MQRAPKPSESLATKAGSWAEAGYLTRLTDFSDYIEIAGRGLLGTAAVRDRLRPGDNEVTDSDRSLVDILGLS